MAKDHKKPFFKQQYAAPGGHTASTAGRSGQTANGRFTGGRQTMTAVDRDGKKTAGRKGRMATRRQQYYDVRVGLGLAGG